MYPGKVAFPGYFPPPKRNDTAFEKEA